MFQQLKCTPEGLSSEEGASRLQIFGPNKLEEKKVPSFLNIGQHIQDYTVNEMQLLIGNDFNDIGKQTAQVSWVHVESSFMGHGNGSHYGNCSCKWWWEAPRLARFSGYYLLAGDQLHHQFH